MRGFFETELLMLADFERALELIKIGDPIKTLFNPKFHILQPSPGWDGTIMLLVTIQSPDAVQRDVLGSVTPPTYKPAVTMTSVELTRSWPQGAGKEYFPLFVQAALRDIINHEIDESLYFNGSYVKDPHPRHD